MTHQPAEERASATSKRSSISTCASAAYPADAPNPDQSDPVQSDRDAAQQNAAQQGPQPPLRRPEPSTPNESDASGEAAPAADTAEMAAADTETAAKATDTDTGTDTDAIPALEPPVPLTARLDPRRAQKRWFFERIRETPSWLSSLVAHLALLLILGSYMVPPGKRQHAFDLLLLFTEADDPNEEGDLVVVHTTMLETAAERDTGDAGANAEAAEQEESPIQDPQPAPAEEPQPVDPVDESESQPAADADELTEPTDAFDEGDEIPSELATLFTAMADATVRVGGASRKVVVPAGYDEVTETDRIVDDFIEFDVGRLRGPAGANANQRFQRLGRDAIPALVRGLNKSAHIRASCPVVVIAQKLENELNKSSDPVMIQFAIDRLGEGVSASAPHHGRVMGLREKLRRKFITLEEQLAATAAEWSLPPSDPVIQSATDAAGLDFEQLRIRIASPDPVQRAGALLASTLRTRHLNRDQRYQLGLTMSDQLARERDLRMAQVHHYAMERLAYDSSPGVPLSLASNPVEMAQTWRAAWETNRADWRDREAAKLLNAARTQQRGGKTVTAAATLQRITTQYPESGYAAEANALLGSLDFGRIASAQFNRARTLEQAGNAKAALRYYEEIQVRFPETKAASLARQRGNQIRAASTGGE